MLRRALPVLLLLLLCAPTYAQTDIAPSLATKATVSASSEESNKGNFTKLAIDGSLKTRWCPASGNPGEWIQLDLGAPKDLKSLRLHWEGEKNAYKYKVEGSADGTTWKMLLDHSQEKSAQSGKILKIDGPDTRYLKITFLGSASGGWGSIREIEVSEKELEKLPDPPPASVGDVSAPAEFNVTMFGVPPEVNYPVCLTAAPNGEVFVGVDEQGSLGKETGRGKVLRCVDSNGDGVADKINVYAKMDHPRGLIYDNHSLWVLHPPTLSVFHDDNHDGVSDRQETLITGISTADVGQRGADHTTNGIQLGIDGWIYIAVGDYGVTNAVGTDGRTLNRRGGGVIRVRPDGTDMEFYAWGLRNILDACIDPVMNMFTRDNTNDGGGWDVRLSQIFQSAEYGYPSLYLNFKDEIMPPLADYGGGSGCGGMFLDDARWPKQFGHALYTCDWGRSEVYLHHLTPAGPTFTADQQTFVKIPRPTDVDVDGSGRMYISSWKGGQFNYDGPNIGFVAQVVPKDLKIVPFPDLQQLQAPQLIALLDAPDQKHRQHAQLELLRRGKNAETTAALVAAIKSESASLFGKVAAIYTLKQLDGATSNSALIEVTKIPSLQAAALRALTDRKSEVAGLPNEPFLAGLTSTDPVVRVQAVICIGRLGRPELADAVLPLTLREDGQPASAKKHNEPDPASVIPHLAVRTLVLLNAVEPCLNALNGPYQQGALAALKSMHTGPAVSGLIAKLGQNPSPELRQQLLTTLTRLYHREGVYEKNWWGTRPDRTGPYYDRQPWEESPRIAASLHAAFDAADANLKKSIVEQLQKHQVKIDGVSDAVVSGMTTAEANKPIEIPKVDPKNPNQVANMPYEQAFERAMKTPGDAAKGRELFERQSCNACHTVADGQAPKGPHLVDIGKRYKRAELIESILKPSAKIAQGFDTQVFMTTQGKVYTGFVSSEGAEDVQLRQADGVSVTLPKQEIEDRTKQPQSMMPVGIVNNLTPEQLSDLIAWLEALKS
ncbi:DUF7133 domain-containing protein [Planctomicrobium piriforme]|uniref:Putative heme-binding domain-containing protein n=1 Tax=Planctomicrobium piriforme TaxID=1576369 RepID=A0A1I3GN40_9PLAN|nr:discoidin domain-containing protein [Planctomicrobium piriforme]SFI24819.1 putative heme-binding domain-containing protein [Planctomicrobium piriforme]